MYGIQRKPFQTLYNQERITCVQINDHNFRTHDWFMRSVNGWQMPNGFLGVELKVYQEKGTWDRWVSKDWDFVLVVPWDHVRLFWSNNSGMQAWRHRKTGYTIPDHCRQTGGCPEVWTAADVKGKRELSVTNLDLISRYIVFNHEVNVARGAFPEHLGTGCSS